MTARLLFTSLAILSTALVAVAATGEDAVISVRESGGGTYVVAARFSVPAPAVLVRKVLTDYAGIPRFMPDVRTSRVLERNDQYVRVEQEAVSRFMLFSKKVHLVLDIEEGTEVLRFRDRCNKSFALYEGTWTMTPHGGVTGLTYELTAQPAFSVPGVVLRKLLNRDAREMIDSLRAEIAVRAASR